MAVFLRNKNKHQQHILDSKERKWFLILTFVVLFIAFLDIKTSIQQTHLIENIKAQQFKINQSCQQALSQGGERNSLICVQANELNQSIQMALEDQYFSASEYLLLTKFL
ncbi:MAG: hypothetical protein ACK5NC_04725 [Vibrio sp.]